MDLLSLLIDVKVQSDVIFAKVFQLEKCRYHVKIWLIKNDYFPEILLFVEYLLEQLFLLID